MLTRAMALKKLISKTDRHSSGVKSTTLFTGVRTPWLIMRLSIWVKDFKATSTTLGPTCNNIHKLHMTRSCTNPLTAA